MLTVRQSAYAGGGGVNIPIDTFTDQPMGQ